MSECQLAVDTSLEVPAAPKGFSRVPTPLAGRLRAARLAAGFTGRGVCARTGIDPGNLCRMEQGRRVPSLAILLQLAETYGITVAALIEAAAKAGPDALDTLSPHLPVAAYVAAPDAGFLQEHERHWKDRPDLRENARRFAMDVFEPVQQILGVSLQVESGYRSPSLDRKIGTGQAPFSAHTHGLAADVTPLGMTALETLPILRAAVRRGDLEHLDFATVEGSRWLHIQAAPDALPARQVIAQVLAC
jgi:transcriptional regulator with XRE-family HTH domain